MSYIVLQISDIESRMSEAERGALEDAGQEGGYVSRLPGIIVQVTAVVRSKVATCRANVLAPEGIPHECLYHAVTLCRHALLASLPVADGYVDPRQAEYRAANEYLDQVASCAVTIAAPDNTPVNAVGVLYGSERRLCF